MTTTRRTVLQTIVFAACLGAGAAQAATPEQLADFFRAVQTDDPKTVRAMLGKAIHPDQLNPIGGEPALVLAVREGAMRVFEVLLNHPGINLDATAVNGNTALMMAAYKRNMPAVQALVAKGAAVNRSGWTALHYAAAAGDNDIARFLLQRGAQVDALSPPASGAYTPLMMAAREGHDGTALMLMEQGANPALANTEGLNAVQLAERAGKTHVAAAISARAKR